MLPEFENIQKGSEKTKIKQKPSKQQQQQQTLCTSWLINHYYENARVFEVFC